MSSFGSILTNSGALSALNSISQTSQTTNQLQNELASGLAISSPSDNPAGYIAAQGFTSQINGLNQAASNANQGVSLLQTAQSAIGQQISVVQQLNSIAIQAANGTETSSESQSLQNLVGQLTDQVSTIANQTQFNNINLLDGSFSGRQFQVGANEGQTLGLSIGSTMASAIGMNASTSLSSVYKGADAGTANGSGSGAASSTSSTPMTGSTVAGGTVTPPGTGSFAISLGGTSISLSGDTSLQGVAQSINQKTSATNVSATVTNNQLVLSNTSGTAVAVAEGTSSTGTLSALGLTAGNIAATTSGAFAAGTATIVGSGGGSASITSKSNESAASIAQAVNNVSATTGVQAQATTLMTMTATAGNDGNMAFTLQAGSVDGNGNTATIGAAISVNASTVGNAITQINGNSSTTGIVASQDSAGNLVLKQTDGQNISVNVTDGSLKPSGGAPETGAFLIQGQVQLQSAGAFSVSGGTAIGVSNSSNLLSLSDINVKSASGASQAVNIVKYALQGLSGQDGQLGAMQQRMAATINNLTTTSTDATTALGVVQDANIPAVANQLTQAQIQAQSGVAALKSSTQLQQAYLSLLP